MSEQVPVYIKEISVVEFRGFRGENIFSFIDEKGDWCRWTVFLGNNNSGKTNLLKAIASLEPKYFSLNNDYYVPINYADELLSINEGTILNLACTLPTDNKISYQDATAIASKNKSIRELIIYGYGVVREIEKKGISTGKSEALNSENIFYNAKLINFEDWLFQLDYASTNINAEENNRKKAIDKRNLLTKVITSEIFPAINDIRFTSDEKLENYIEFQTEDGWHKMSELGYGYQATLSWMADFCKKLFDRYPDSPNPLKEAAVVLIDEIDLHLHPQWQRGLIKSLSDIFPLTQFIVTTHSPFIIQSMENVNLYTLNRVGDHTEVTHLGNKSYIGWKIEEILSEVMGLEDNINTDVYQALIKQFDKALDKDDYKKGKEAYDKLMQILHPQSAERKLLDIQFTQLSPTND